MNSNYHPNRLLSLGRIVCLISSVAAMGTIGRAQVQTQNGYLADPSLSPPEVSQSVLEIAPTFISGSYNGTYAPGTTAIATFIPEYDNTGMPTNAGFAIASTNGSLDSSSGLLDPSVTASLNSTVNSTLLVDSSLTYSFEIIPAGGLNSSNTSQPVNVDITGLASVTSTGSFYDTAYNSSETASLELTLPGLGTGKIVNLSGLSSDAFDFSGGLLTGVDYTLTMDASLYAGGEDETLQATVDPEILVGSGYSVAFSPGFPGSGSGSGNSVPDDTPTAVLAAIALGALLVVRYRFGGKAV